MLGQITRDRTLDSPSYPLTPWQEDNKIPQLYLNTTILPSTKHKKPIFAPSMTKIKDFHPKKLIKQPFTFKSHPLLSGDKSIGFLECIQYTWVDPKASLGQQKKEKRVIVARRRTKKGLQIKSIKKKIVNSNELQVKQYPFFEDSPPYIKERIRFITESKLNTTTLIPKPQSQSITCDGSFFPSNKLQRSRKGLTSQLSREFLGEISTIANLSREKRRHGKCRTEEIPTTKDWMLQRDLFLKTNPKFADWQRGARKAFLSGFTLTVGAG